MNNMDWSYFSFVLEGVKNLLKILNYKDQCEEGSKKVFFMNMLRKAILYNERTLGQQEPAIMKTFQEI